MGEPSVRHAPAARRAHRRPQGALIPLFRRFIVCSVALALALAACGGGHKAAPPTTRRLAPTTTTAPAVFPLTGLPVSDATIDGRPVLVVKIENAPQARPQSGLEAADVVYEEVVEGGLTRFLAVFQSRNAASVGPIRSVRPTDPLIVWPLGGLFAYSGGTKKFIGLLHQAPVRDVGIDADTDAYTRDKSRKAPHDLYSSTSRLYEKAKPGDRTPPALFSFLPSGQTFEPAGATAALHVTLVMGSQDTVDYDYDVATGTWKRSENGTPHVVAGGVQIAPTNVVVQYTPYVISPGDFDVVHEPVYVAQVVGSGDAWIFSGGKLVKGRWSKTSADTVTSYTDASGAPIALEPGSTWVELAPTGASTTVR